MEINERETQITQLCRVFISDMPPGSNLSPRPIVEKIFEKNNFDFASTLEDILNFDYDLPKFDDEEKFFNVHSKEKNFLLKNEKNGNDNNEIFSQKNKNEKNSNDNDDIFSQKNKTEKNSDDNDDIFSPINKTQKNTDNNDDIFSPVKNTEKKEEIDLLQSIFGGDFTKSIISTVYTQNKRDITLTIDLLLNISNDDETIEAIRNMDGLQRKKLEEDMKNEQLQRLQKRCLLLEREIQLERSDVIQLETMGERQQLVMKEKLKEIEEENTSDVQQIKPSDEEIHKLVNNQQDHGNNSHDNQVHTQYGSPNIESSIDLVHIEHQKIDTPKQLILQKNDKHKQKQEILERIQEDIQHVTEDQKKKNS